MNIKKGLYGVLGVAAVILLIVSFKPVTPRPGTALGAVTSPEITENHFSVNGVTTWVLKQNFSPTASTTLCTFPNPAGAATSTTAGGQSVPQVGLASSTLVDVSVQITTGTSTALDFDISTSTTPWATSTQLFAYNVTAASGAVLDARWDFGGQATSSDAKLNASVAAIAGNRNTVGPAQFVNVLTGNSVAGATKFGYLLGGQCTATFKSLNAF